MRLLLIDKITQINESTISGEKYITINEDIYEYHFPRNPVLPAAFMIEGTIQLSRIFFWMKFNFEYTLLPLGFKRFKFYKTVSPSSILNVTANFDRLPSSCTVSEEFRVHATGTSNGIPVFEGVMLSKVIPFGELHNETACRDYVRFLVKGFNNA